MAGGKFVWRGAKAKKAAREAAVAALRTGAEAILTESQAEVPHETGTLQRSGTVTEGEEGGNPVFYVSYNTPYARRQHEDTSLRHDPGRKAKYLEDPFKRNRDKVLKFVRLKVHAALRGRE